MKIEQIIQEHKNYNKIHKIIEKQSNNDKGENFEKLVKYIFILHPSYRASTKMYIF